MPRIVLASRQQSMGAWKGLSCWVNHIPFLTQRPRPVRGLLPGSGRARKQMQLPAAEPDGPGRHALVTLVTGATLHPPRRRRVLGARPRANTTLLLRHGSEQVAAPRPECPVGRQGALKCAEPGGAPAPRGEGAVVDFRRHCRVIGVASVSGRRHESVAADDRRERRRLCWKRPLPEWRCRSGGPGVGAVGRVRGYAPLRDRLISHPPSTTPRCPHSSGAVAKSATTAATPPAVEAATVSCLKQSR